MVCPKTNVESWQRCLLYKIDVRVPQKFINEEKNGQGFWLGFKHRRDLGS